MSGSSNEVTRCLEYHGSCPRPQPYLGALAVVHTSTVFAKKAAPQRVPLRIPIRLRDQGPFLEKGRCSVEQDVGFGTSNRPSICRRYSSFTGASRPKTYRGTVSLPVRHLLIRRNWTRMAIGCVFCCGLIELLSLIDGAPSVALLGQHSTVAERFFSEPRKPNPHRFS